MALYGVVPYLSQSWSIGTEEQFYLFWPFVIQYSKRQVPVLLILLITFLLFKYGISMALSNMQPSHAPALFILNEFLHWLRIESMFIGAIFATVLFYNDQRILKILVSRFSHAISIVVIIVMLLWGHLVPMYSEIYSLLFGLLIINFAASPHSIINLDGKLLNFLGRISYGLYMLQSIAIVSTIKLLTLPYFNFLKNPVIHLLTVVLSLLFLLIIATVSYYYLEQPFLNIKKKFMLIKSSY